MPERVWLWALRVARHEALIVAIAVILAVLVISSGPSKVGRPSTSATEPADAAPTWFLQVSDMHISVSEPSHLKHLERFVAEVLPAVDPAFVLVTGDIVDSRNGLFAQHHASEWKAYGRLLNMSGLMDNDSFWIEILGNHDMYGLIGSARKDALENTATKENLFVPLRELNISNPNSEYNYKIILMETGPKMPVQNIMGSFSKGSTKKLRKMLEESTASLTLVVGHHPLGEISSNLVGDLEYNIDGFPRAYSYHIAGHNHQTIYARPHKSGPLIAAIDTLKFGGYRVLALENGRLSFTEAYLGEWPVVVPLNPKPAALLVEQEPALSHSSSSTVRCLVFNPNAVIIVEARVDGVLLGTNNYTGLNYTSPEHYFSWDASSYTSGLHEMAIRTVDSEGESKTMEYKFSLDGTLYKPSYAKGLSDWMLRLRITLRFWAVWFTLYLMDFMCFLVVPMIYGRFFCWWAGVKSEKFNRISVCFGPVATAWINTWENGSATLEQIFEAEKLNSTQKVVLILTWQLQYSMWQFSKTPTRRRLIYIALALIHLGGPMLFVPYSSAGWVGVFPWGFVFHGEYHQHEFATAFSGIFLGMVLYPALSIDATFSHLPESKPGPFIWWLMFVCLLGTVLLVAVVESVYFSLSLLLSPLLWSSAALLFTSAFFVLRPYHLWERLRGNHELV